MKRAPLVAVLALPMLIFSAVPAQADHIPCWAGNAHFHYWNCRVDPNNPPESPLCPFPEELCLGDGP